MHVLGACLRADVRPRERGGLSSACCGLPPGHEGPHRDEHSSHEWPLDEFDEPRPPSVNAADTLPAPPPEQTPPALPTIPRASGVPRA